MSEQLPPPSSQIPWCASEMFRYCRTFTEYYMSHLTNVRYDEHAWAVVYWPPSSGEESLTIWKNTLDYELAASYRVYSQGHITKNASPRSADAEQDPFQEFILEDIDEARSLIQVLKAALPGES